MDLFSFHSFDRLNCIALLVVEQSYDRSSPSEVTLYDMDHIDWYPGGPFY